MDGCIQMCIQVVGIFLPQFYNIQYMCSTRITETVAGTFTCVSILLQTEAKGKIVTWF